MYTCTCTVHVQYRITSCTSQKSQRLYTMYTVHSDRVKKMANVMHIAPSSCACCIVHSCKHHTRKQTSQSHMPLEANFHVESRLFCVGLLTLLHVLPTLIFYSQSNFDHLWLYYNSIHVVCCLVSRKT